MKIVYFDCFSGISGDMILGALVDAGLPLEQLKTELNQLSVRHEFEITAKKIQKHSIAATKVDVIIKHGHGHEAHHQHGHHHPHRRLADIEAIVRQSQLKTVIQEKAMRIFRRLAEVEAKIHDSTPDEVMLHEVSAIDSIVDIVGIVIGLDYFEIERIYTSPVTLGRGLVTCAHGVIPVPGPAVVELLKDYPVDYNHNINGELCTPTGAAVIAALSSGFKRNLKMKTHSVGYGAGSKEFLQLPNLLRVSIGEELCQWDEDVITVIETNIDDMNPELYPYLNELLLTEGALDVYLTPALMKKGRPGHILSVLCLEEKTDRMLTVIYRETTTIGVRMYPVRRQKLPRTVVEINSPFGKMKVKMVEFDGQKRYNPEYEECRRIARDKGLPIQQVYEAVMNITPVTD
jgi:hypothetical protein